MDEHEVFISYARRASREHAVALHDALAAAGIAAFLDTDDIEDGDRFPQRLVDGVLDARVFVLFADPVYFGRWYCIREMKLALAAYEEQVRRGAADAARDEAVAGTVVAMAGGDLRNLPPRLANTQWPPAAETARLVERVRGSLASEIPTFRERTERLGALREHLLEEMAVPPPRSLRGETVLVPAGLDPSIGDSFVGRADDLWRLHMTLSTTRAEAAVAAALTASIEGGGGFGKTRLAREYLWRFADAYPGGWFWVDADVDDLLLDQRHYDILKALDGDVPPLKALREAGTDVAPLLAGALQKLPADSPALMVVDNLPEPTPGQPASPLQRWCPALGFVTTLATSRWKASVALREVATIELETLAPDAAVLMVRDQAPDQLADEEWHELAAWVGQLPLALEVLNAALRHGAVGGGELLETVRTQGPTEGVDELAEALMGQVPAGALRGIRDALSLSLGKLSPEAQHGAGQLAQLGPEPIPTALIKALGLNPKTRSELRARSIVTPVAQDDVELYGRMHRVMADLLRAGWEGEPVSVVGAVTAVMSYEACQDPARWPLMLTIVPHVEAVLSRASSDLPAVAVDLRLRLGMLFWSLGLFRRALSLERSAAAIAERELGADHPTTINAWDNLASTLLALGEIREAHEIRERVVASSVRVHGADHSLTLVSRNNLAATLAQLGHLDRAREILEEVAEAQRALFGLDHPSTLTALNNLGDTLRELGQAEASQHVLEGVVASYRRLGQFHSLSGLRAASNLASAKIAMGDARGAVALLRQVVDTRTVLLGEQHPSTLTSQNNLAVGLRMLGEMEGARNIHIRVVDARSATQGDAHPDTIISMRNLASTLRDLGEHHTAAEWDARADAAERRRDGGG